MRKRTDYPNGTCARVAFTPWSQTSWDANDTVLDPGNLWFAARQAGATPAPSPAEQRAATLAAEHAGTPMVVELDPLERPFLSTADLTSNVWTISSLPRASVTTRGFALDVERGPRPDLLPAARFFYVGGPGGEALGCD